MTKLTSISTYSIKYAIPSFFVGISVQCLIAYNFAAAQSRAKRKKDWGWLSQAFAPDFWIEPEEILDIGSRLIIEGEFPWEPSRIMPDVKFSSSPRLLEIEEVFSLREAALTVRKSKEAMEVMKALQMQRGQMRNLNELIGYMETLMDISKSYGSNRSE